MSNSAELLSQQEAYDLIKKEKREKKEKRDKLRTKAKDVDTKEQHVPDEDEPQPESEPKPSKKRKREALPDEIEIDISLPEPVSKKAARKAKKPKPAPASTDGISRDSNPDAEKQDGKDKAGQRSEYGVWIGNLPWSATRDSLRTFLSENSDITNEQITRVHMPAPTKPPNPSWTTKPLNKGFAYVDFSTQLAMYSAIALTETKMDGRALLIKNAKSFEGRPEKPKTEEIGEDGKVKVGHPPNKRVFVGNLAFDVTKEDLMAHYGQCGGIADLHMATFEDSGKCKGYAWVTFEDVEAATSAVKGYIFKEEEVKKKKVKGEDSDDEERQKKKSKKRKWLVNKLMGRDLRCEFAEDSTTRYNKRYGKEKKDNNPDMNGVHPDRVGHFDGDASNGREHSSKPLRQPRRKVDPRTIKSGAAHTNAPRASQAIVESKGKKISFD